MLWTTAAAWFADHARPLPWRHEPRDPWAVLVSEVMLQQTQVERVRPAFESWMQRWPTPADLAAAPPGAAVRAWAGLGYPRRALRLHAAATAVVQDHEGRIPRGHEQLLALPGVGGYTAAAVSAFAHRRRVAVLDTNVRRVLHRHWDGQALPATASPSVAERDRVTASLPHDPELAACASEAAMEIGALLCGARRVDCGACPLAGTCAWLGAGRPAAVHPGPRRQPRFEGSDRQARGRILALVRQHDTVAQHELDAVWPDPDQRERAQLSLLADGLLELTGDGRLRLPAE